MPTYKLKVIKVPSTEPVLDIKPNFGPLDNLHLEMLENKKKLKTGLPLIPLKRQPVKIQTPEPTPLPSKSSSPLPEATKKNLPKPILSHTINKRATSQNVSAENSDDEDMRQLYSEIKTTSNKNPQSTTAEKESSDVEAEDSDVDDTKSQTSHADDKGEDEADVEAEDDGLTQEERDENERQEYLVRFRILKRGHPTFKEFPDYTEHTSLPALKKMYTETVRLIQLEENVDSYKMWLRFAFIGFEVGMRKLGVDFKDFAKMQMKKMDKYEKLLIELGEKSYSNFTNNWPVEIRLILVFLTDACFFYIGKIMVDYMGGDMAEMMAQMMGVTLPTKEPKVRMRGPSMRPENIRNMGRGQ